MISEVSRWQINVYVNSTVTNCKSIDKIDRLFVSVAWKSVRLDDIGLQLIIGLFQLLSIHQTGNKKKPLVYGAV